MFKKRNKNVDTAAIATTTATGRAAATVIAFAIISENRYKTIEKLSENDSKTI